MSQEPASRVDRPLIRISLACTQCRSRHLKCDGTTPTCSRCCREGSKCTWVKSRRGGRRRRKKDHEVTTISSSNNNTTAEQAQERASIVTPEPSTAWPDSVSTPLTNGYISSASATSDISDATQANLWTLFFERFYPAQPCCLPRSHLERRRNQGDGSVRLLCLVIEFIGALQAPCVQPEVIEEQIKAHLLEGRPCDGPFEVQALVLYLTAVYWRDEIPRAHELLEITANEAIRLGMHTESFVQQNSGEDCVLAESWRRTWWQLYLTDVHVAAINHSLDFTTSQKNVRPTVMLPCEEEEYISGNIPFPKSLEHYENREFALGDEADFSSFAHLIGLASGFDKFILGRQRNSDLESTNICTNSDSMVTAWLSLLPKPKKSFFNKDGVFDELLFKAKLLIPVYLVDIHRSLSNLSYDPIESISTCSPTPPLENIAPIYQQDIPTHTAKVIRGIDLMAHLLAVSPHMSRHAPFTICMISSVTIAHLSACKHIFQGLRLQVARERIRAAVGALEDLAEIWPRAAVVVREVKMIARELLRLDQPSNSPSQMEMLQRNQNSVGECVDVSIAAGQSAQSPGTSWSFDLSDSALMGDFSDFGFGMTENRISNVVVL